MRIAEIINEIDNATQSSNESLRLDGAFIRMGNRSVVESVAIVLFGSLSMESLDNLRLRWGRHNYSEILRACGYLPRTRRAKWLRRLLFRRFTLKQGALG